MLANKLIEKIPDPRNVIEHYQSFIWKNPTKLVKQSEKITYQSKTFENPNIVDIKSIIAEHPRALHKLSKTIRQAEKVGSNSSLYGDIILNSFNPELQLKDTESAIKSKLIDLLTQLKGFKFVTTLVLVFKKIESEDKTKYDAFSSSSKGEIIINESDIDDVFQSIYTTIISNIQKSLGKGSGWIVDSVKVIDIDKIEKNNSISISECFWLWI